VFSTVGTKGNPDLVPEYSRALAVELHARPIRDLVLRAGGDLTRVSDVIVLDPIVGDPDFAYTPINQGKIDIANAFVGAQLATGATLDAFGSYHLSGLRETDPLMPPGEGIPIARHTAALGAVWRPLADLSVFVRGVYASPRRLRVNTAADPLARVKTQPTVRTTAGVSLADVLAGLDLELSIDNPLFLEHDAPYRVDGAIVPLVERRRGTEVFATLRYDR
jgi:hypothetical protein